MKARVAALAVIAFVLAPSVAHAAPRARPQPQPVRRVLVLALPALTWEAVARDAAPELRALLGRSGVAGMTLHGANESPTVADGYVTISTGARAEAKPTDGGCANDGPAIRCPGVPAIARHNRHLLFDADVGLLGATLQGAGVARAVLAEPAAARSAGLALTDRAGAVPGTLETRHLVAAFDQVWRDRSVVLVEPQLGTDVAALVAALESRVDRARDAVLVVSPSQPEGAFDLTVAALQRPGQAPGLMRSAYTRHAGSVALVDVAPTILDLFGIERPAAMEGRAFEYARAGGNADARVRTLVATDQRAQFRDRAITQVDGIWVGSVITLGCVAILCFARGKRRGWITALELAALALLFLPPATYLAMLVPWAHGSLPAFWLFVVVVSAVSAVAAFALGGVRGVTPLMLALAAVVGLIVVDVLAGAHLQFNGAFGYSPTIGGRYAGLGNLGYAQLAAAVVILAGLVAYRVPGRAGIAWAGALLGLAVVVDGAPFFGADVGGVLSMIPAFAIMMAMLTGRRVRASVVAAALAAAVVVVGIFAAIDLARPAGSRSHLGRLLGGNGSDLTTVLERKLSENFAILQASPFAYLLPIVFLATAYIIYRAPGPLRVARDRIPQMNAAFVGLGIVAVLGTALNDSGIAITGVMFGITVPSVVLLCTRAGLDEPEPIASPPVPVEVGA